MCEGINYAVSEDARVIQIFGDEGMKTSNGLWYRNNGVRGTLKEDEPSSEVVDELRTRLDEVIDAGKSDQIAYVRLGSYDAVTLFLEGLINLPDFLEGYEEQGFIVLPKVKIPCGRPCGCPLDVSFRIFREKRSKQRAENEPKVDVIGIDGRTIAIPPNLDEDDLVLEDSIDVPDVDEIFSPDDEEEAAAIEEYERKEPETGRVIPLALA